MLHVCAGMFLWKGKILVMAGLAPSSQTEGSLLRTPGLQSQFERFDKRELSKFTLMEKCTQPFLNECFRQGKKIQQTFLLPSYALLLRSHWLARTLMCNKLDSGQIDFYVLGAFRYTRHNHLKMQVKPAALAQW
jgi:hypothetical protein